MKFGVMFANVGPFGQAGGLVHLAQAAERVGIESLWTVEHVVVPKGYRSPYPYAPTGKMPGPEESPIPDPLVWLGYAAAVGAPCYAIGRILQRGNRICDCHSTLGVPEKRVVVFRIANRNGLVLR